MIIHIFGVYYLILKYEEINLKTHPLIIIYIYINHIYRDLSTSDILMFSAILFESWCIEVMIMWNEEYFQKDSNQE